MKSSHPRLIGVRFLPPPHLIIPHTHTHKGSCMQFKCLALYVTPGRLNCNNLSFPNKLNALTLHQQYSGLINHSQLRQLVLFNVKCYPIWTLAEMLKNTSIKNSDLLSHCQSQLPSAKQHSMCSWHNFINNLGKQRILQQIAVAFWLYCATDNNCFKLSVVESICSCIMKKKDM